MQLYNSVNVKSSVNSGEDIAYILLNYVIDPVSIDIFNKKPIILVT